MVIPNISLGPFTLVDVLPYVALVTILGVILLATPFLVWYERVALALIQDRLGPNRVGPRGLLQAFADGIKLFLKEDIRPSAVDATIYYAAPVLMMIPALAACAVLPVADLRFDMGGGRIESVPFVVGNVNIGILYLLGLTSLQVYGIVLAGWASNNKYSLMGGLRSSAQTISYELSMTMAVLTGVLISGSTNMVEIVRSQAGTVADWNIAKFLPLGFIATVVYLIAMVAETNRAPFDLPEAESELVAGFHTEYSSMKFAMFFMCEYASMLVISGVATALWFGGWNSPHPALNFVPGFVWFILKVVAFVMVYVWVRATLPRLRYDALMALGWKRLLPIALAALVLTATWDAVRTPADKKSGWPVIEAPHDADKPAARASNAR
jgi:NADH-quinone oxidoreductase subunit H